MTAQKGMPAKRRIKKQEPNEWKNCADCPIKQDKALWKWIALTVFVGLCIAWATVFRMGGR